MHPPAELFLFARPVSSLAVEDAAEELRDAHSISREKALEILRSVVRPLFLSVFPHTYRVELHEGNLTSTLVSTYGEESTLRLIRSLRRDDPDSFT